MSFGGDIIISAYVNQDGAKFIKPDIIDPQFVLEFNKIIDKYENFVGVFVIINLLNKQFSYKIVLNYNSEKDLKNKSNEVKRKINTLSHGLSFMVCSNNCDKISNQEWDDFGLLLACDYTHTLLTNNLIPNLT